MANLSTHSAVARSMPTSCLKKNVFKEIQLVPPFIMIWKLRIFENIINWQHTEFLAFPYLPIRANFISYLDSAIVN